MRYIAMVIALALLTPVAMSQPPTDHPRLFFGPQDTSALIDLINQPGSDAQKLFQEVKQQSDWYMPPNYLWHFPGSVQTKEAFYEGLLSHAFRYLMTHNTAYSNRAKDLIFRTDPIFRQQGIIWDSYPVGGLGIRKKVITLAIMYDWLYEQLSASERTAIQDTIIQDLAFPGDDGIREYFNQETIDILRHEFQPELSLLLGAMSIYGENPDYPTSLGDQDIDTAIHFMFTRELSHTNRIWSPEDGVHGDGAAAEGVFYGSYQYAMQIPFMHVLGRKDAVDYFQQESFRSRLAKAATYFCYEVLPAPRNIWARYFNSINDSYKGFSWSNGFMSGILLVGAPYGDPLATWVFENTVIDVNNFFTVNDLNSWQANSASRAYFLVDALLLYDDIPAGDPSSSLPRSKHFPERGLSYIRTSENWADENDIQFSLTASPAIDRALNPPGGIFSVKHDQPDKNSMAVSAFGKDLILDVGYVGQWPEDQNYIMILDDDGRWKGFRQMDDRDLNAENAWKRMSRRFH